MMEPNFGIEKIKCEEIAKGLYKLLEQTYDLYTKTQNFHWNVTGREFLSLHQLFESQYNDLSEAVDTVAERIRTLGFSVTGTYFHTNTPTKLKRDEPIKSTSDMVLELMKGHEGIARSARLLCMKSGEASDFASENLLADRIQVHEKSAWILRSILID